MTRRGWLERFLPFILIAAFALAFLVSLRAPRWENSFDLNSSGRLPVLSGGRIKPLDTVARTTLLLLSGKQTLAIQGHSLAAWPWLLDVMFRPEVADGYRVFAIDNTDVLGMMGIQQTDERRFSFKDLKPHFPEIEHQAEKADASKSVQRTPYQTAIVELEKHIVLYGKLQNTLQVAGDENRIAALAALDWELVPEFLAQLNNPAVRTARLEPILRELERYRFLDRSAEFYPLPLPGADRDHGRWISYGAGVLARAGMRDFHPGVPAYGALSDAWRAGDSSVFNQAVSDYRQWLGTVAPRDLARSSEEYIFNYVAPFYQSLIIYLVVFLLAFLSWIVWSRPLNRSAFYLLLLAFALHTLGLMARMMLQGRPPVTNLYSSAVFVGWVAVLLGIFLEGLYRNGIGSMVSAVIGFTTLIIAHHLAATGDTLEMMRAVLDSNFWLSTHVVSITIGYGSTFLSGFLGILFILRERLDRHWNASTAGALERMTYGIVCFSMFFSFLGTILGGIWADQSWGRFWGWDPKENGALMIVLWNAFVLHARLGGYGKGSRLMVLVVFGNIVTAFSWFGVNMLGIGLHSYGFMEKAFVWLVVFAISQVCVIVLGLWPRARHSSR